MSEPSDAEVRSSLRAELEYLWDEYKYRHALCWNAVYKVVASVVALSVLPYINEHVTRMLSRAGVIPPIVGAALATYGMAFVIGELKAFQKIKVAYRTLQDRFFDGANFDESVKKATLHEKIVAPILCRRFDRYVIALLVVLVVLSVANVVFVWKYWLPYLRCHSAI